jgi:microcystin-dependent protein
LTVIHTVGEHLHTLRASSSQATSTVRVPEQMNLKQRSIKHVCQRKVQVA